MHGEAIEDSWKDEAACRGKPGSWWFPPDGRGPKVATWRVEVRPLALAVCAGCPVRAACLEYAHANGEETGVWGGVDFGALTAKQRRASRRGGRTGDGYHLDDHVRASIKRRSGQGVSARELASMFRITERSVYRCLETSS